MSKTISFKQIVKWIHPDHNPNIENSSEKMNEAVLNMDNEEALYRLAVKWELIEGDISQTDIKYKMNEGKSLQKNGSPCIILDTYWQNNKLIVILYNKDTGKYEKHQCVDEYDQNEDFLVDGIYSGSDYFTIDYNYQLIVSRRGKF